MEEEKKPIDTLGSSLALFGVTSALGSMLLGGLDKMFGNREEIPKGVVKEMMHGLMLGVIDLVNEKDCEIRELKDRIEQQKNDIKELTEEKDTYKNRYDEVLKMAEDVKKRQEEVKKKPEAKKK